MSDQLSKKEKIEYKKIFNLLDQNKTGQLTFKEMKFFFKKVGIIISDAKITKEIEKYDHNKTKTIGFNEFLCIVTNCDHPNHNSGT